ncbi:TolC family protein [Dysgonomonas macrotermitis]|uniref:Outer membrane protein TolC n=1 Tax=Dysgonomonas macrotermitis TaxID=1346286 RepID=A0A1M4X3K2_9BACT|nr:TolC family protein [Dysgonomonas macrotermitis]SHE88084.1 Outer membrane protein TolC [Dysgonomonas macrotermitis]
MSKFYLLTVAMCMLLCAQRLSAQEKISKTLTLDEMFHLATENSKQLKVSQTAIETAKRATDVARNLRLPSLDASLALSYLGDATLLDRDFGNITRAAMPHFGNNFAFEASQVVFAGGAISNSIAKAELEEQVARLAYEKDQMNIRFLLTGYYLDLYKLINQRKVYIKNIEQTRLLIEQIRAKQREGMALNNDITRHELTLQNYNLALIEIDNNSDILNHHLVVTLGLPYHTQIMPDTTILNMNLVNSTPNDMMLIAENNLPELKTATVNIDIAEKGIKLAKADYLPSVALVAVNYLDGPITIEVPPINKNLNYWYVGVGIKYNLSSIFKTKKNVRLAKAQQSMAVDTRNVITEQTETAIHTDATRYKESFEKLNTFEKSLQLANENYRIINNRYTNDLVLITEMLDASNTKLNAELQVVNAKINIIYNYYKLQRTIGKL